MFWETRCRLVFLQIVAFSIIYLLVFFGLLRWAKNKRPRWKNVCAFLVELGSAYSISFALDMLARSAIGDLPFQNTILPISSWTSCAILLHYLASVISVSNKPLFIAYFTLGGIATSVSFIHLHNLFVGLSLLLIASILFFQRGSIGIVDQLDLRVGMRITLTFTLIGSLGILAAAGIGTIIGHFIPTAKLPVYLILSVWWLWTGWKYAKWRDKMSESREDSN